MLPTTNLNVVCIWHINICLHFAPFLNHTADSMASCQVVGIKTNVMGYKLMPYDTKVSSGKFAIKLKIISKLTLNAFHCALVYDNTQRHEKGFSMPFLLPADHYRQIFFYFMLKFLNSSSPGFHHLC